MKKGLACFCAIVMLLCLSACGARSGTAPLETGAPSGTALVTTQQTIAAPVTEAGTALPSSGAQTAQPEAQTPATQATQAPATQPPATQAAQPPATQATQPPATQATQPPATQAPHESTAPPATQPSEPEESEAGSTMRTIRITIGSQVFSARLYDNAAADALVQMLPMTLNMSELNGNEKYNYLSSNLPTNPSVPAAIHAGELMLYGSNCLVLFYESFTTSYSYTPLGYIENTEGLLAALGSGSVQVSFHAG